MSVTKEINPIEAVQTIVSNMQAIESKYFEANKAMKELNERQNDLVHTLELDLSEEETLAVANALKKLRKERREIKDLLINLSEAKDFVGANYKFMNEGIELVKKMQVTEVKTSNRKYYVRNCEAIKEVIDVTKYSERIGVNTSTPTPVSVETKPEPEQKVSAVDKFNKKWGLQK